MYTHQPKSNHFSRKGSYMLRRFMRPKKQPEQPSASEAMHPDQDKPTSEPIAEPPAAAEPSQSPKPKKPGLFKRLTTGLTRTRNNFTSGIANVVLGKKTIDDALMGELETQLLLADAGVEATQKIIQALTDKVARKQLSDGDALFAALQTHLQEMLVPVSKPLIPETTPGQPYVILMVGINGSGKTTTIGKLAKIFQAQGKQVMLAAGDTFRAAAVEQLQTWGERNNIPVIAQQSGADSASVIYDAVEAAKARGFDILIADTAGRLHTQTNLMEELKKVRRVMTKLIPEAPHEVMLVLDAGIGQNALVQAQQFNEAVGVTGLTLTKLDGTAKGGIVFSIADKLGTPIRYIGVGETIDDLRPFDGEEFVKALFTEIVE
ncbi:MAG: signal recognition particle-docking protein FtsY [Legionellales bacterium]|nr:signal recognition particle-docking protein FtsY [Legionellales bacterium]